MIHVIATIELAPGKRRAFLDEFARLVPLVLDEAGCIEYGPTVDVDTGLPAQGPPRDNTVTVVEKWESLEHLEDHLAAPHMLEYRKRVKEMVLGTSLQILRPATATD